MSERAAPRGSTLPAKHLPGVSPHDLPEPVRLRRITGASVIILATALGSGEYVLWPYITSQIGFVFLWAAIAGFALQYFLNMEVERYTLATGETALTGFARLWSHWWWLFVLFALAQNFWPGWATSAATVLTFVFGWDGSVVVPLTVGMLVAIGLVLTLAPVVYQAVERIQMVMVALIMVIVITAVVVATSGSDWVDAARTTVTEPGFPVGQAGLGTALLLGALAFAGAGGANNLVQSNYIRDKGMGMGHFLPRVVSPVTGQETSVPSLGYYPRTDAENLRRWRGWWRVANQEQLLTFLLVGVVTLVMLSVLAYANLPVGQVDSEEVAFVFEEGQALQRNVAPWFGVAFWLAGAVALLSTNLGIIDYTARLIADQVKIHALARSRVWSESKIYAAVVWLLIASGSAILLLGLEEPFLLVVISSSIAGVQMFVYSGLLVALNRRALPGPLRIGRARAAILLAAFVFFGLLAVLTVLAVLRGEPVA
ncbi:hypothetical protein GCM10027174_26640 [Salinifilum aidingensis]